MEVKPSIGIGDFKFGMKQDQIESIYGKPDTVRLHMDDSERLILEYNDLNVRLTLYKDESNKLGYITTTNNSISYNDKNIIGVPIDIVTDQIFDRLIPNWEIAEYEFLKTFGEYNYWITLNVQFGKVKGLELGVKIDDDDEYEWPE